MFNLIIKGNCDAWSSPTETLIRDRFLEYTRSELRTLFLSLGDAELQKLKSLPTLFACERNCGNPVRLGKITDIRVSQSVLELRYVFYAGFEVSVDLLVEKQKLLDVDDFEFNRTHWSVKDADVLESGLFTTAPPPLRLSNRIFVVHGHDDSLKNEVKELLEQLGLQQVVLHLEADKGRTIIEKFEECSDVGFAVVLLTPDDVMGSSAMRARQNVILELGYFYGKLGRSRVCALKKGHLELPSDVLGVLWKSVDATGSWRDELTRELDAAGYNASKKKRGTSSAFRLVKC